MTATDGWRYIAQRFSGTSGGLGDFIDFNVPLQDVNIELVLSGHNSLTGTIKPEHTRLKGTDGQPLFIEGGTAIWAEDPDGEIRGGGLLTHSGFGEGGKWDIECTDLTGTAIGIPFDDGVSFVNVDPIDLFRYIWTHIQAHQNHNLGMTVDSTTSPKRLGSDLVEFVEFDLEPDSSDDLEPEPVSTAPPRYTTNGAWRNAAVKAMSATGWDAKVVEAALTKWLNKDSLVESGKWEQLTQKERTIRDSAISKVGWPPNPPSPGRKAMNVVNIRPQMNPPQGGEVVDPQTGETPTAGPTYQYEAYKLNWYDTLDLGAEMDDLAANTPFDWHLTHWWNEADEIRHHIRIGYPRIGIRQEELRFVVGENIHEIPDIERDGTEYANEVVVLGAGEGASMVRARSFRRDDGRIRKVVVISDPTITDAATAQRVAEAELAKRYNIESLSEVILADHPHAPMGSVNLGDDIFIEGDLGWIDHEAWYRVVAITFSPDASDSQVLTVIRSDRIV